MKARHREPSLGHSRARHLSGIDRAAVPRHPLARGTVRTLRYMQDIETHTVVYLRTLLATRAIDDPDIATFLACWFYEETAHGRALARILEAAGHPVAPRVRSVEPLGEQVRVALTRGIARA